MQAKDEAYFETAIAGFPYMSVRTERIDVVVGSGHRAQTYLYWRGDQLFELPALAQAHAEKPPSIVRLAPLMYVDSGRAR